MSLAALAAALLLAGASCAQDAPALPTPARLTDREHVTIVTLGDSITFGAHMAPGQAYPERLQALLDVRYGEGVCRVMNAGLGGQTTVNGLARLDGEVLPHKPDIVILSFGVNDSVKDSATGYRVPPERFEANLRELVGRVRAAGAMPILATSLGALEDFYFDRHPREFYEPDGGLGPLLERYRGMQRQVAGEERLPLADWHRAFADRETALLRTPENSGSRDGVHPTPEGYKVIALECFLRVVEVLEGE